MILKWFQSPLLLLVTLFAFTFHMRQISIVRSLHFRSISASFLITFLSPEIATSINIRVLFSLSRIMISGSLLGMVLTLYPFDSIMWLPQHHDLLLLRISACSYRCSFCNFTLISLHMLKCSPEHTLSCLSSIVLLPLLGVLTYYGVFCCQFVVVVSINCRFFVVSLVHHILFVI